MIMQSATVTASHRPTSLRVQSRAEQGSTILLEREDGLMNYTFHFPTIVSG